MLPEHPEKSQNPTTMNSKSRNVDDSMMTCSCCGRAFRFDETDAPPFCSQRCKLIDLGRWLDEEVGVPHEGGPTKGEAVDPTEQDQRD